MFPRGTFPTAVQKESGQQRQFSQPLIASVLATIKRRKVRRRGGLPCSSCNIPPPTPKRLLNPQAPPATARRRVPSTAIQAKHRPLSTLARRVITLDWEQAEGRIRLLCYFSRSGLHSQSSRQTSSSSFYTVVALKPVYSHTPWGTLTFDSQWFLIFSPFFFRKYDGESIKKQWKNSSAYCFSCQIHACWNPPGSFTAVKAENTVATFGSHFYRIFVLSHIFHFSRKRVSRH